MPASDQRGGRRAMEQKLIGRWTDDKRGTAAIEQRNRLRVQCETMDEYGPVIEYLHAIKVKNLLSALCIDALGGMQNKRKIRWSMVEVMDEIWIHLQGVCPAKP